MRVRNLCLSALLLAAGCVTIPPPDPITVDELVALSKDGPNSPALLHALETRPLGFALTYESLKNLEKRGVPAPVIDVVVEKTIDRRARALAPRYAPYYYYDYYYYDPYPWPYWPYDYGRPWGHWHRRP